MLVLSLALALFTAGLPAAAEDGHDHTAADSSGHHHGTPRPDSHAPIGVMGDHTHGAGEWMASYRYMRMLMTPNRIGTTDVSPSQILLPVGTYMIVPTEMTMDMHMFGLMYAPSDRVTLMGMFPFVHLSMDHVTAMGVPFTTKASGIGDIGAAALVNLVEQDGHQLILNAGMTFPTGSIDRKDVTPASTPLSTLLPYPMQLGSGTWDLKPGLTYNGQMELLSWGAQALGTIRIGRNQENYRLGHAYEVTGWGAVKALDWLSLSGRLKWSQWFDIEGIDSRLTVTPPMIPTADPTLRAGRRLDIGPGANFVVPSGPLAGVRLAVEALFPVYQNLDGPQLATDWTLIVGTQYAW